MSSQHQWISHLTRLVTDCISVTGYVSWEEYEGPGGKGFEFYPAPMRLETDEDTLVFPPDLMVNLQQLLGIVDHVETFYWDSDGALMLEARFAGQPFMLRILRSPPDGVEAVGTMLQDGSMVADGEIPGAAGEA